MKNSELREKALGKAKARIKGLTGASVIAYLCMALTLLAGDLTGNALCDIAIELAVGFVLSLMAMAGYRSVGLSAWRRSSAAYADLAGCFTGLKRLAKGAVPALMTAIALTLIRQLVFSGEWYAAVAAGVAAVALYVFAAFISYAGELDENAGPGAAVAAGVSAVVGNIPRILEMLAMLYWWVAAALAGTVLICRASGLSDVPTTLVTFLAGFVLCYLIAPYNALAEAGLGREIFKK